MGILREDITQVLTLVCMYGEGNECLPFHAEFSVLQCDCLETLQRAGGIFVL